MNNEDLCYMHEAGHFIFFVKAVINFYGKEKAAEVLDSCSGLTITVLREDGKKKGAFFLAPKETFLSLPKNLLFWVYLGGIIVDLAVTKRPTIVNNIGHFVVQMSKKMDSPMRDDFLKSYSTSDLVQGYMVSNSSNCADYFRTIYSLKSLITEKDRIVLNKITEQLSLQDKTMKETTIDLHSFVDQLF